MMKYFHILPFVISIMASSSVLAVSSDEPPNTTEQRSKELTYFDYVIPSGYELFAVFNSSSCVESLMYGPSQLSEGGSADGHSAYLSTNTTMKNVPHQKWVQLMMGGNGKWCSITYQFDTPRTLEDHFVTAVNSYVLVDYTMTCQGYSASQMMTASYFWRFSATAGNMTQKFAVSESTWGFSDNAGIWGVGGLTSHSMAKFWGIMNQDSVDSASCSNIYVDGKLPESIQYASTFMYFVVDTDYLPTLMPTPVPSDENSTLSAHQMTIIAVCSSVALAVLVCLVVLWYKCRHVHVRADSLLCGSTTLEPGNVCIVTRTFYYALFYMKEKILNHFMFF